VRTHQYAMRCLCAETLNARIRLKRALWSVKTYFLLYSLYEYKCYLLHSFICEDFIILSNYLNSVKRNSFSLKWTLTDREYTRTFQNYCAQTHADQRRQHNTQKTRRSIVNILQGETLQYAHECDPPQRSQMFHYKSILNL
jgi:hypothetical protein